MLDILVLASCPSRSRGNIWRK